MIEKIKSFSDQQLKDILKSLWSSVESGKICRDDMYDNTYTIDEWECSLVSEMERRRIPL